MKKMSKKAKKKATIEEIEKMAMEGQDTGQFFGKPKKMPPRETQKMQSAGEIVKVNVDLTSPFLSELDEIAIFLNVSRQSVMKNFLKDGVDRHFLAKQARRNG